MSKKQQIAETIVNNMVLIKEGELLLPLKEYDVQLPPQITLQSFYINKYPVSVKEWSVIMEQDIDEDDNLPMTGISWDDSQVFLKELNELTGGYFRLPSRIEWEYAALGGISSHGYQYSGSNNPDEVAWYRKDYNPGVQAIGLKSSNELGLYDMSGNIWEWCQDWCPNNTNYHINDNAMGNYKRAYRVIKGGSCALGKEAVLISSTYLRPSDFRWKYLGVRLAF